MREPSPAERSAKVMVSMKKRADRAMLRKMALVKKTKVTIAQSPRRVSSPFFSGPAAVKIPVCKTRRYISAVKR